MVSIHIYCPIINSRVPNTERDIDGPVFLGLSSYSHQMVIISIAFTSGQTYQPVET